MRHNSGAVVALSTCANSADANKIAHALVEESLAACVSQVAGVKSLYKWEGKICEDAEILLIIKTRAELIQAIEERFKTLHPYGTPELVALPIESGAKKYLEWLEANTHRK